MGSILLTIFSTKLASVQIIVKFWFFGGGPTRIQQWNNS